jgi:hypothetical protein
MIYTHTHTHTHTHRHISQLHRGGGHLQLDQYHRRQYVPFVLRWVVICGLRGVRGDHACAICPQECSAKVGVKERQLVQATIAVAYQAGGSEHARQYTDANAVGIEEASLPKQLG